MLAALGGDAISPQRRAILDAVVVDYLLLCSVDAFIATMPSPINKSKRQLFPIITERARLAHGSPDFSERIREGLPERPIASDS